MSSLSLEASIRTCKVDTGNATRVQSDRFQNPRIMVCPVFNGFNSKGQEICIDSKRRINPGCRSALDRVSVESFLRPKYAAHINLTASGIDGDIYGDGERDWVDERNELTGQFGNQWISTNYRTCGVNAYENAMAQEQQQDRVSRFHNSASRSNRLRSCSGN